MSTILITGSNRGIGLELCRQFAARGDEVIATCRKQSQDLAELSVRIYSGVDVTSENSVQGLANDLNGDSIDVIINNAGILTNETLDDLNFTRVRDQFEVNALGVLRITQALLPNLKNGSKVIHISSRAASFAENFSGGLYGYKISKAAADMIGINLSRDLKSKGIAVAQLYPGVVATNMTRGQGISPAESANNLISRIDKIDMSMTGTFWPADSPHPLRLGWRGRRHGRLAGLFRRYLG